MRVRRISVGGAVLNGFILWLGTYAYLYFFPITGFKPLYSYLIFSGFVGFRILTVQATSLVSSRGAQEMLLWAATMIFLSCVFYFFSSQSDVAIQKVVTWIESAILLCGFTLLLAERQKLRGVQALFSIIAVVAVLINFYDFFSPTFSTVPGRAAGLYGNPNIAGKFIAFSMVLALPVIPRKLRLWFVVFCGLGVLVTFSRNSWLLWGIGVVFLGWTGEIFAGRYRSIAVLLTAFIGIGVLTLLFTGTFGQKVANSPLAEYLSPNTLARLGVGSAQFSDHSANERQLVALMAFEKGAESPFIGKGLAYTNETGDWPYRVSTHNMYLLFWAEGGLIGLALYIWFVVMLWRHSAGVGRVLALQIMIVSFFTHNQLDQPAALIFPAFAIVHGNLSRRRNSTIPVQKRMVISA